MSVPGRTWPVVVIGAGQAGLATAFHLRRAGLDLATDVLLLDAEPEPGGSWQHMWRTLRLFSPPAYSSLPGWPMPASADPCPDAQHVVRYLRRYQARYEIVVRQAARVTEVRRAGGDEEFAVQATSPVGSLRLRARHVVSATGTWTRPFVPLVDGRERFAGRQLHSSAYRDPEEFAGARVVVVGGGNTGAQLVAELSLVSHTTWATLRPPRFLPDDVDGRRLFEIATARRRAIQAGAPADGGITGLGDIVAVEAVRRARERGAMTSVPMFTSMTRDGVVWPDRSRADADIVLWCTGFRPELRHLRTLPLHRDGTHPAVEGTTSLDMPRLHLVGYGDWTGPASATLIGVGGAAKAAAVSIATELGVSGDRQSSSSAR